MPPCSGQTHHHGVLLPPTSRRIHTPWERHKEDPTIPAKRRKMFHSGTRNQHSTNPATPSTNKPHLTDNRQPEKWEERRNPLTPCTNRWEPMLPRTSGRSMDHRHVTLRSHTRHTTMCLLGGQLPAMAIRTQQRHGHSGQTSCYSHRNATPWLHT